MKKFFTILLAILFINSFSQDVKPDAKAEALITDFMKALLIDDSDASAKECLKYVHKSLMNSAGDDLTKDLRSFSFKKAHSNAKFYASPVKITRVRTNKSTAIGYGDKAEKGTEYSYFIGKKAGVNGMPAPLNVFFPADGGAPKISYMGSL